jgi:hypothetical protein
MMNKGMGFPPFPSPLRGAALADHLSDDYGKDGLGNSLEQPGEKASQGFFLPLFHHKPPYQGFTQDCSRAYFYNLIFLKKMQS